MHFERQFAFQNEKNYIFSRKSGKKILDFTSNFRWHWVTQNTVFFSLARVFYISILSCLLDKPKVQILKYFERKFVINFSSVCLNVCFLGFQA